MQEAAFLLATLHPDPEARPTAQALSNKEQLAGLYHHIANSRWAWHPNRQNAARCDLRCTLNAQLCAVS